MRKVKSVAFLTAVLLLLCGFFVFAGGDKEEQECKRLLFRCGRVLNPARWGLW